MSLIVAGVECKLGSEALSQRVDLARRSFVQLSITGMEAWAQRIGAEHLCQSTFYLGSWQ